jgi:hypothetical protein
MDDPDPLQIERSQFYKELLTVPSAAPTVGLGPRNLADLQNLERAVIDKNLELGHRVTFLVLTDPGDSGIIGAGMAGFGIGGRIPVPSGYDVHVVRKWTISAPPSGPVTQGAAAAFGAGVGRGGRGGRGPAGTRGNTGAGVGTLLLGGGAATTPPVSTQPRQGPTYSLLEVLKSARVATGPRPAATTR